MLCLLSIDDIEPSHRWPVGSPKHSGVAETAGHSLLQSAGNSCPRAGAVAGAPEVRDWAFGRFSLPIACDSHRKPRSRSFKFHLSIQVFRYSPASLCLSHLFLEIQMDQPSVHVPVMPREVLHYLQLTEGLTVMDGTVGAGGHSAQILERIGSTGRLIGFDRDPMMLEFASEKLNQPNAYLFKSSYTRAQEFLPDVGLTKVDRVFLDLGLSSDQLADRERGFGFDSSGPLDMRFNPKRGKPASELLKEASVEELVTIFKDFGEEPFADRIANYIVGQRKQNPFKTTDDLEACVRTVVPGGNKSGKNPATRVFQALRIAVNNELEHVQKMMTRVLPEILNPDGIAVVLTFHSLEDRIVKSAFKGNQEWQVLTKKPVESTPAEIRINPRTRSAKLRAVKRKAN